MNEKDVSITRTGSNHSPLRARDAWRRSHARCPEDTVTVQSFLFQATLKEYLSNVYLFGNVDNLVNKDDQFGMYDPKHSLNPSNQELLSIFWYHKTYKRIFEENGKEHVPLCSILANMTSHASVLFHTYH